MSYPGFAQDNDTQEIIVRGRKSWSALGFFIAEIEEELAWATRRKLEGLNFYRKDNEWLMIVKATRKGKREVTFIAGPDIVSCYRQFYRLLKIGRLRWKEDKYQPRG